MNIFSQENVFENVIWKIYLSLNVLSIMQNNMSLDN